MQSPAPHLTFSDLMAKTGYFVLYWSMFERALSEATIRARDRLGEQPSPVRGGLKERLQTWADLANRLPELAKRSDTIQELCTQALQLRDIRNLIIHGLDGGSSMPESGEQGYIRCVVGGFEAPTGEIVRYTTQDIEHFLQGADACRRGCLDIACFNYRI